MDFARINISIAIAILQFQCYKKWNVQFKTAYPAFRILDRPTEFCRSITVLYILLQKSVLSFRHKTDFSSCFIIFGHFRFSLKTLSAIPTKLYSIILHHIRVLYVQFYENSKTGIRTSQKENYLIRLLYRTRGSGFYSFDIAVGFSL